MPGTFSQVYMQYVFAVKGRENLIKKTFEQEVYKYMAGIISGKGQKPLAVNGMPDHVHLLVGLKPAMRISDLVRDIKNNSSNFINEKGWLKQKFSWQEGYGVFSYSESNYGKVIDYIKNQKRHHEERTFRQEYLLLLKNYPIVITTLRV
jgi:putative transposase